MASARASVMGVRLQVLLVITSPPVGETVNFRESALQAFCSKTLTRRVFFYLSRQPVSERPARCLIKSRHESHCGLQKTSLYLHETAPHVNKHFREFNDFSTICGRARRLSTLFRPLPRGADGARADSAARLSPCRCA